MSSVFRVFETTFARSFAVSGIGVHSGAGVTATFNPASAGTGIVFNRILPGGESVMTPAIASSVTNTDLCTVIGQYPARSVATIEHVMAALYASGVDNAVIDIDGGEFPVMDGSSTFFMDAFAAAGIVNLEEKRRHIRVLKPVRIEMGAASAEFLPHDRMHFDVTIDFDCPLIGRQQWAGDINAASFRAELSRARTFGFMRDVEKLWAIGLARGSSLENSVVIDNDDCLVNPEGLRWQDEFVRHKALDAVGDIALAGAPFLGIYRSYRGGHKVNSMALKALLADQDAWEFVESVQNANVTPMRTRAGHDLPELVAV